MKVNEIFLSIQGESMSAGLPTVFVRFTGCNLRCGYCDTTYAYAAGSEMTPQQVCDEINKLHYKRVCLTGGEPLLQNDINELLILLAKHIVTIETNGSVELGKVRLEDGHSFVMDMKTPSSGCAEQMVFENFDYLTENDEIKFVVGSRDDYEWSKDTIASYYKKGAIIFSSVFGRIAYSDIVEWILNDKLDIRFQVQLHKLIWEPNRRGV